VVTVTCPPGARGFAAAGPGLGAGLAGRACFTAGGEAIGVRCWSVCCGVAPLLLPEGVLTGGALLLPLPLSLLWALRLLSW
jgi:hypothetical protein